MILALLVCISTIGIFYIVQTDKNIPNAHAAATLLKDLPGGAPKQEIIVDDIKKFNTIKPVFTASSSKYIFTTGDPWSTSHTTGYYQIYYNGTFSTSGTSSDTFSLRWNKIAKDSQGNDIDILLKVSNIRNNGQQNPVFILIYPDGMVYANATSKDRQGISKNWFDVEYFFYKSGTNNPSTSKWTMQFKDLDAWKPETWDESVRLLANYEPTIHIIPDTYVPKNGRADHPGCWLTMQGINDSGYPTFRANQYYFETLGITNDSDTLHTGFCTTVKSGFKFSWWGNGCATAINDIYGQSKITASAGTGGSITNNGTTEVPWKNDKSYKITPSPGYKIKDILADGKSVGKQNSYTFKEVTQDHVIHATFEKIRTPLTYDKNLPAAMGTTPGITVDAGTNAVVSQNGFYANGYTFNGWNTKPDGSGTTYQPGTSIPVGETAITLYAQWKPTRYTVSETHTPGGTVTPDGKNSNVEHGSDYEWTIETELGYRISLVEVNGTPVEITNPFSMKYLLSAVDSDNEIHVKFEQLPATITYDANAPAGLNVMGSMDNVEGEAEATHQVLDSEYTIEGWTFIGWSTTSTPEGDDTDATLIMPGDETSFPSAGKTTTLYAQWRKNPTLTVIVEGHGTAQIKQTTSEGINLDIGEIGNDSQGTWILDWKSNINIDWNTANMWYIESVEMDGIAMDKGSHEFTSRTLNIENMQNDCVVKIVMLPMVSMPKTGRAEMLFMFIIGTMLVTLSLIWSSRRKK